MSSKGKRNIAVIGAGASGIAAALTAARMGASVTVYEHKDSPLSKLLVTGNGKCNFTNERIDASCYHSSTDDGKIDGIIKNFDKERCLELFDSIGIKARSRKGCYYPYSDTAESVRTALLLESKRHGVEIITSCGSISIEPDLAVRDEDGKSHSYDSVIIACGSSVMPRTGSDGSGYGMMKELKIPLTPIYPALTPLKMKEDLTAIRGIRCDASLKLIDDRGNIADEAKGELQPYEGGLSGICAMDISSAACRMLGRGERVYVEADLFPQTDDAGFLTELRSRTEAFPDRNIGECLTGLFPKKLINYIVHPVDSRKPGYEEEIAGRVKHLRFELDPAMISDFSRAQTVSGGVGLGLIDIHCMLKDHEGIYVTGELLDADGICGGYNLHFAFATGTAAGAHAASKDQA